jgi:hypothetical protein
MIRRVLIPLSLCCAVLCAFIGYLSHRAIEESKQVASNVQEFGCRQLIDKKPRKSTGVVIQDFIYLDRYAALDFDGDDKWDEVAVPVFPNQKQASKAAYQSVIVWFKDVPNQEALQEALKTDKIRADYWVAKQNLDEHLKSQLAIKFKHMDFENSPVVLVGFAQANPLLGPATLKFSYVGGLGALGFGALAFLMSIVMSLLNRKPKIRSAPPKPTANKAGLPPARNYDAQPTGGVLDQVKSMRDRQPET